MGKDPRGSHHGHEAKQTRSRVPAGPAPTSPPRDFRPESRGEVLPPASLSRSPLRRGVGTFSRASSPQRLRHCGFQLAH